MATGMAKDMKAMGLSEGFSVGELKSAFRKEAKLCHPDLSGAEGLAFARLRDRYDRLLEYAERRDERAAKDSSRTEASRARASGRSAAKSGAAKPRAAAKPRSQPETRTKPEANPRGGTSAGTASSRTAASGGAKKPREPKREWLKGAPGSGGKGKAGIGKGDERRSGNGGEDADGQGLVYYQDALQKYEAFQAVNRDRSMELKFLYGLTKKNIALVDLHTFLRLLDTLEERARASLLLFTLALERGSNQAWAPDAQAKSESLDRQLSRCMTLRAEVSGAP
jgi:hypothetical protein